MAPNSNGSEATGIKKGMSFGTLMHVYDHDDEGTAKISKETVSEVMKTVQHKFEKALGSHVLAFQLKDILSHSGFTEHNTMLGTSFCCDDVNRDLEDELRNVFGNNHSMGGLAGFCFGGVTSMADMLHHIPEHGHCVLVYGPHIGVDFDGVVGKVNRRGHLHGSGVCCASAHAAAQYAQMVRCGERQPCDDAVPGDHSILGAQQAWVEKQVLKHAERLAQADDPAVELPHALFECQNDLVNQLVQRTVSQMKPGTKLAVVGGIQINTPEGTAEYFLPKRFDLLDHNGAVVEDMLEDLHNSIANTPGW